MNPKLEEIWVYLSASPLLGLTLTLLAYQAAFWIYKRVGFHPLANPVLISVAILASLLLATALVNLIPENPYLPFGRRLAGFSNVLNFHGLTQLVDSLWPYAALAYLSALGLWRGEHLAGGARQRQPHL